jgi:hypothetical protein
MRREVKEPYNRTRDAIGGIVVFMIFMIFVIIPLIVERC